VISMDLFIASYIKELNQLLNDIDTKALEKFYNILNTSSEKGSRVYILGNGGSSATASHMANDLKVGLGRRDIISIDAVSLADNSSVITALANDVGYENIFYMQLKNILKPDDIIIAISCSGNSPNILKAVKYAKKCGNVIIGMTGFDGGKLKELSDIKIHSKTVNGKYGLVEDMHMIINHMISCYFQGKDNE